MLEWIGVYPERPLMTQVSRLDPWKDPLRAIAVYRLAAARWQSLNRPWWARWRSTILRAGPCAVRSALRTRADPRIHVFANVTGFGNVEVNALQRLSRVVVQKSIREGFGLVVSEAPWKETPVVAGRAGGIKLQMADGVGGVSVDDLEGCAAAVVEWIRDRPRAEMPAERDRNRLLRGPEAFLGAALSPEAAR